MFSLRSTGLRVVAVALLMVSTAVIDRPTIAVAATAKSREALTPDEQVQAQKLAVKIAAVIAAMPANSGKDAFTAAILGVTAGIKCKVVRAAIAIDMPSLSGASARAADGVSKACGPIGAVGQNPDLAVAPGFTPGGGGSNYSQ
jgi:hypothetical protein